MNAPQDNCGQCGHDVDDCQCRALILNERIVAVLWWCADFRPGATATQICGRLNAHSERRVTLAAVSSALKKLYDANVLDRTKGFGPRGGYGYTLKGKL